MLVGILNSSVSFFLYTFSYHSITFSNFTFLNTTVIPSPPVNVSLSGFICIIIHSPYILPLVISLLWDISSKVYWRSSLSVCISQPLIAWGNDSLMAQSWLISIIIGMVNNIHYPTQIKRWIYQRKKQNWASSISSNSSLSLSHLCKWAQRGGLQKH